MQLPRTLIMELLINGGWVDVAALDKVRQAPPVTVTRGRANEAAKVAPTSLTAVLDDTDGRFSPRNPVGAYAGQLHRNLPCRAALQLLLDELDRTSVDSWSAAPGGFAYTTRGAGGTVQASDYQMTAAGGTHSVPTTSAYRETYLATKQHKLVDVRVTFDLPGVTTVTGGAIEPANVLARGLSGGDYYMARVVIGTDQLFTLSLFRQDGTLLNGPIATGVTYVAGHSYTVAMQAEGWMLRAKVWDAAGVEPYDWPTTVVSTNWINGRGFVGVRSGVASGNTNAKPISFRYTRFEVRSPRAAVEVSSWAPQWDLSHANRTCSIKAHGPLRRLGQGASPVRSALRRWLPTTSPAAYWTLGTGVLGTGEPAVVGTGVLTIASSFAGQPAPSWATGELAPWLEPGWAAPTAAFLQGPLSMPDFTNTWTVDQARTGPGPTELRIRTSSGALWIFDFEETGNLIRLTPPGLSFVSVAAPSVADGNLRHLRLTLTQSGANVAYVVYLDGSSVLSGSAASITLAAPTNLIVGANEDQGKAAISSVAFWATPPDMATAVQMAKGFPGETAGARMVRLAEDEGIPFGYEGDLTLTARMGPQRLLPLVKLLDECAAADLGTLYETRGHVGLYYRTLRSLYNQPARATLNYDAEQVADPFIPVEDDQLTRNEWTVERDYGGEVTVALTTGPMSTLPGSQGGVGRTDSSVRVNLETDSQLLSHAGHLLSLGTIDEPRFPSIRVEYGAESITADLADQVLDIDVDDVVAVVEANEIHVYGEIRQIARGSTEALMTAYRHTTTFNGAPASPYDVVVFNTDFRLDSNYTTLRNAVDSSATSMVARVALRRVKWTTAAPQQPVPLMLGGEEIAATITDLPLSFVGAGTGVAADNASLAPTLHASTAEWDLILMLAAIRNSGTGAPVVPAGGWFMWLDMGNAALLAKVAGVAEATPTVTFSGGAAGATTLAQCATFRGVWPGDFVAATHALNGSAQDIAVPALTFDPIRSGLVVHAAWKQDDLASIGLVANGTLIGTVTSALGSDASISWNYRLVPFTDPFSSIGARTFVVTGGAAAISRGGVIVVGDRLQTLSSITRSVNGVVKGHAADTPIHVAPHSVARLAK